MQNPASVGANEVELATYLSMRQDLRCQESLSTHSHGAAVRKDVPSREKTLSQLCVILQSTLPEYQSSQGAVGPLRLSLAPNSHPMFHGSECLKQTESSLFHSI